MSKEEKQRGYNYFLKRSKELGIATDLFDFEAEIGEDLTYTEIVTQLEDYFEKIPKEHIYEKEKIEKAMNEIKNQRHQLNLDDIHNKRVILIFGETRSGKTSLAYKLLEKIKKKKDIYIYKHPLPKAIELLDFKNMDSIETLSRVVDCAVYIDEPQLSFSKDDKKSNVFLKKLYTLAGQRGITIILSTSDSRWVNKGTEAFVNSWFIKDCEVELIKNGSKIKNIIRNYGTFGLVDFKLNVDEFIYHDRSELEKSGKYTFEPTSFWNDILSKPYR